MSAVISYNGQQYQEKKARGRYDIPYNECLKSFAQH